MSAIFKREFNAYFSSPIGYVFIAMFYCLSGFFFFFSYRSTFTRIWSLAIILSYHLSCHRRTCRD